MQCNSNLRFIFRCRSSSIGQCQISNYHYLRECEAYTSFLQFRGFTSQRLHEGPAKAENHHETLTSGLVPFCCSDAISNSLFFSSSTSALSVSEGNEPKVPTTAAQLMPAKKLREGKHEGFFERTQ